MNQTGWYEFALTNSYGCQNGNEIYIQFDHLDHVKPKTNMPDTFTICKGDCINYFIYDSITNPTAQNYVCFPTLTSVITTSAVVSGTGYPNCSGYDNLSLNICPTMTGPISLDIKYIFSSSCGKDTAYFHKVIYAILNPVPQASIAINGNTFVCPGDSTLLTVTYTVSSGANISYTISPNDSIWATPGIYFASITVTNTLTGCTNAATQNILVQTTSQTSPYVHTNPANGLICPHDSVELICTWPGATAWQWHGPAGILPGNSPTIYDSIPGYYYCVATNTSVCNSVLTSNTVEIKKYNTPYLIALPQTVVCAGQKITLHVVSNDTSLIQWLPPFSGGGTSRTVTQSGTYSCKVTMCGITTTCNITVTVAQPVAHITPASSLTICPGDSVLLNANSGMASYLWLPVNSFSQSTYVYYAGTYTLIATDGNGCQARDSITVYYSPQTPPAPAATNDSICAGSTAGLQVSFTGTYVAEWYAQPYSGSVIYTGSNYTTPPLSQNTTYYVSVKDNTGCHSVRTAAHVYIKQTSLLPQLWGDTMLCERDTLHLFTNAAGGAVYHWSGPDNFNSSALNPVVTAVNTAKAGTYSLYISGNGCTSPQATWSVSVTTVPYPMAAQLDSACEGSAYILHLQAAAQNVSYSWNGPAGFSSPSATNTISPLQMQNAGTYYVQAYMAGCYSIKDSLKLLVKHTPLVNVYIQPNACLGDSVMLYLQADTFSTIQWSGPGGFQSTQPMPIINPLTNVNNGYYSCMVTFNGCAAKDSAKLNVRPLPYFAFGNDTTICSSQPLLLYPGHFAYYLWNDSIPDSTYMANTSQQITLTVYTQYGCRYSDTLQITAAQCELVSPNIFSPNGDGVNDIYSFKIDHYQKLEILIYDRWGNLIFKNAENENSWNGMDMQSKRMVDEGVYFYIVNTTTMMGLSQSDHGFIQVVR